MQLVNVPKLPDEINGYKALIGGMSELRPRSLLLAYVDGTVTETSGKIG